MFKLLGMLLLIRFRMQEEKKCGVLLLLVSPPIKPLNKDAKESCLKTGGLARFSRTKANREVTKTWSDAVVGRGSSISGTFGGAAIVTV